jgi:C-terminal processing protease CtpA/Prc
LPNGQTIDKKGLVPDVAVTLGNPTDAFDVAGQSQDYSKDAQLKAALALLPG